MRWRLVGVCAVFALVIAAIPPPAEASVGTTVTNVILNIETFTTFANDEANATTATNTFTTTSNMEDGQSHAEIVATVASAYALQPSSWKTTAPGPGAASGINRNRNHHLMEGTVGNCHSQIAHHFT